MKIDTEKKIICASGPGGSGKSNFFRWLFQQPQYHRHIIFDTQREFDPEDYNVYRPDALEYPEANEELNDFLREILTLPRDQRPRYIHVADCAEYIPGGNRTVGGQVARLIQQNTHIFPGITFSCSARRPQDIDSGMRELANYFLVFGAKGKSTWRELDEIATGVEDAVKGKQQYQFAMVFQDGTVALYDAVKDMGEYDMM